VADRVLKSSAACVASVIESNVRPAHATTLWL